MQPVRWHTVARAFISSTPTPPAVQRWLSSAAKTRAGDDELRAARTWLANLHAEAVPLKSIGELSFSRSSGPGGQNVNKYDTLAEFQRRAILSMPKESILKLL